MIELPVPSGEVVTLTGQQLNDRIIDVLATVTGEQLPPEARANYENLRRYGMFIVFGFIILMNVTPLRGVFNGLLEWAQGPYYSLARTIANLVA